MLTSINKIDRTRCQIQKKERKNTKQHYKQTKTKQKNIKILVACEYSTDEMFLALNEQTRLYRLEYETKNENTIERRRNDLTELIPQFTTCHLFLCNCLVFYVNGIFI